MNYSYLNNIVQYIKIKILLKLDQLYIIANNSVFSDLSFNFTLFFPIFSLYEIITYLSQ
jgi:hypothetical protein